jgi:AAA domain, putative AbiEii toxin, Type IV TA system
VPDANPPRLLSFTLDGWSVLGGPVTVSLEDRVAVLVGRNGAGKSAILEGFEAIAARAIGKTNGPQSNEIENFPKILSIKILTPDDRRLSYRYELLPLNKSYYPSLEDDSFEDSRFSWNDSCMYLDGDRETLWTTEDALTTFNRASGPSVSFPGNIHVLLLFGLRSPEDSSFKLPSELTFVFNILRGVRLVGKTIARQNFRRRSSYLKISANAKLSRFENLADDLAEKISRMNPLDINELEEICQRIGLGMTLSVRHFAPVKNTSGRILKGEENSPSIRLDDVEEESFYSVFLDDINIGLLSDGTLRVLSILVELMSSYASATIIIEEPEIQIHPGMLEKLLNEIESYTFGSNLILSSHSPQVVAWTDPNKIHLVHRQDGRTYIRKLGADDIHNVTSYLQEDGNLGEWIYSGILDE